MGSELLGYFLQNSVFREVAFIKPELE